MPRTVSELIEIRQFGIKLARRHVNTWIKAINRARDMGQPDLPRPSPPGNGPPPVNRWADRAPDAARRLESARSTVTGIAEKVVMPSENLLLPDTVRRLSWAPPTPVAPETVSEFLRSRGARNWQIALTAEPLTTALRESEKR